MRNDGEKTREELLGELAEMRQRVAELQTAETELKRTEERLYETEEELRAVFDDVRDGIAIFDLTGKLIRINRRLVEVGGWGEEVIGKRINSLKMFSPKSIAKGFAAFTRVVSGQEVAPIEVEVHTKAGERVYAEIHGSLLRKRGKAVGVIAVVRDITERKGAEEALLRAKEELETRVQERTAEIAIANRELKAEILEHSSAERALSSSEERLRILFEFAPDPYYLNDLKGTFIDGNRAAEAMVGYKKEELVGKSFLKLNLLPLQQIPKAAALLAKNALGKPTGPDEFTLNRKDGTKIPVEISTFPIEVDGRTLVLGIARDISGRKRVTEELREARDGLERRVEERTAELMKINQQLQQEIIERKRVEEALRDSEERYRLLSTTDGLTGLHNRRRFYEMLEAEIDRTRRYGSHFSVTMLDLDGFKEYNDRFGHINGDAVLKSLADALRSALRRSDMAFRYGGDEFAIILPATDADRALEIVDRVRSKWLRTPKAEYAILETPLGFSAGIAQFPENAETADGLVFLADTALLHAKGQGGYKSVLVSELGELSQEVLPPATMDQVYALAATVDARDPYTYGHSKRVAAIAESVGKATGLSIKQLADLHAAALLHDIGKIGVPDSVLAKPGNLTNREWELIKKHSAEGAKIVGYIRALSTAVPMILSHHEWYDGSGYPGGLKGEDIPLGARIISIADTYDTMTTPRLYRDVISQEEALEELRRCAGTQFDPELVEVFCRAMNEQGLSSHVS